MSAAVADTCRLMHATAAVGEEAAGALAAQSVVDRLRDEWATPDAAWLAFIEVAARHGWKSAASRGFVCELAKRASR